MKESQNQKAKPFRILSLDGGGIRGSFVAGFLADVEHRLNIQISDYFDLIAGTSTGAIIAAALAFNEPASRIVQFYKERGPTIFRRQPPVRNLNLRQKILGWMVDWKLKKAGMHNDYDSDLLWQSKYSPAELEKSLTEVFGNKLLGHSKNRLIIPAVDLTRGQTIVFKTSHFEGLFRDAKHPIVKVLLATTAAPTYFPPAVIEPGSCYADGGLWANNPGVAGIAEAMKIREKANRDGIDLPIDLESIYMLSIGTGKAAYFAKSPDKSGMAWWGPKLYNVSSVSQSQGIGFQSEYFLGTRSIRIDYDLPDGRWNLDNVDFLEQMAQIGSQKSVENLERIKPMFFTSKAEHAFEPFFKLPD